jgi:hypothetical protein
MDDVYCKVAMDEAVGRVAGDALRFAKPLNQRRRIVVELPEFVIRAIEVRVAEANIDASEDDEVSFNDVVEWLLVCDLTVRRMPLLEARILGFAAAMASWMLTVNYDPDEE